MTKNSDGSALTAGKTLARVFVKDGVTDVYPAGSIDIDAFNKRMRAAVAAANVSDAPGGAPRDDAVDFEARKRAIAVMKGVRAPAAVMRAVYEGSTPFVTPLAIAAARLRK
ncbi:hypothetical protein JR316_0004012 [Psilocybe cubensis]|uniref:Uncharacterized protein n=2 Tax=Psilocybe cubensis TaxID=181762 RepID=A0ACB8H9Y3_PSICU|nr:hypothetical protein JR316_0004012 [Psilocybe cubensis]KAH9484530.1 hypothetical protein JR316_0004012 [Psilocybe cubensis]